MLVDGPASITLTSGKAEVFGSQLWSPQKTLIREGKRLPFKILENATFDVTPGKEAALCEVDGDTIPRTWQTAVAISQEIRETPATVMVVGGVDSGKSSLCTYLANRFVNKHCKVAVLDEDLGQSDIGPPCAVAYAMVNKPVTDLFNLKPEKVRFVGVTSPSMAPNKTVDATAALVSDVRARADLVIVNTDGWVLGEDAVAFKKRLAEEVKPDVVFFLKRRGEPLNFSCWFAEAFAGFKVELIDSPLVVGERNREKRKSLRELGFAKYLENARMRVYSTDNVLVEGLEKASLFELGNVENLLVGLQDAKRCYLGIGIIRCVDLGRKVLGVFTAVEETPAIVCLGAVRLDKSLREIQS